MRFRKMTALLLALLLLLAAATPVLASEDETTKESISKADASQERFNIVFVTDNSGSLVNGNKSDPDNYRHDAISMFLDLLPDSGNNVAAIVFSGTDSETDNSDANMESECLVLNTELEPINSREDKDALMEKITAKKPSGHTDIGTALLAAAKKLDGMTEKNGLRSIIVLFTDGFTQTADKIANDEKSESKRKDPSELPVYSKSIANREKAEQIIVENGITLCGVYLSGKEGKPEDNEILNLVRRANQCDEGLSLGSLEELYIPVSNAESLTMAYKSFFSLITGTRATEFTGEYSFEVPGMGVEEININLIALGSTKKENQKIMDQTTLSIIRGDQTEIVGKELAQLLSEGSSYAVYKLQDCEPGIWKLRVNTPDLNKIESSLLISTSVSASMSVKKDTDAFLINRPVSVAAQLFSNGEALPNREAYRQYECVLEIRKADEGDRVWKTIPMEYQPDTNSYACRIMMDSFGDFHSRVVFRCGSAIQIAANSEAWSVRNENPQAPEVEPVSLVLSLTSPGTGEINLRDLVTDREDGKNVDIAVNGAGYDPDAWSYDDVSGVLYFDGVVGGSGVIYVVYTDTHGGTTTTELRVGYTDRSKEELQMLLVLLVAVLAVIFVVAFAARIIKRHCTHLQGSIKADVFLGEKRITLILQAQDCLYSDLYQILKRKKARLVKEADWIGIDEAAVDAFLSDGKRKLSGIRFGTKVNRRSKTEVCYATGITGKRSVTELNSPVQIKFTGKGSRNMVCLEYNKYL